MARFDLVRQEWVGHSVARSIVARSGRVWFGMAGFGSVRRCMVRRGTARRGIHGIRLSPRAVQASQSRGFLAVRRDLTVLWCPPSERITSLGSPIQGGKRDAARRSHGVMRSMPCHAVATELRWLHRYGGDIWAFYEKLREVLEQCDVKSPSEAYRLSSTTTARPDSTAAARLGLKSRRSRARRAATGPSPTTQRLVELECQNSLWLGPQGSPEIPVGAIRSCLEGAARKVRQGGQVREACQWRREIGPLWRSNGGPPVLRTGFE